MSMFKTIGLLLFIIGMISFIISFQPAQAVFSNESEVSAIVTGGNSEVKTYKLQSESNYEVGKSKVTLKGNYLYGESFKFRSAESWNVLGRLERNLADRLSIFVAELIEANRFAGIGRRYNSDLGLKYILIQNDRNITFVEAGYRFTQEQEANLPIKRKDQKARTYGETLQKLNEQVSAKFWLEYIPNFSQTQDYLITMEPSLITSLTKIFSLKTAYKWAFDHQPIPGNSAYDYTLSVSFLANI